MQQAVVQPPDRGVVVGIGRYPRFSSDLSPNNLDGPLFDAAEMARWLTQSARAHVTLITSNGAPGATWTVQDMRPSPDDITGTFHSYIAEGLQRTIAHQPSRLAQRLYVYMAGHGFAPNARSLALITANALSDAAVPNIEATAWVDWFAGQWHFDEIVLWMDCCAERSFLHAGGVPLLKKVAARSNGRAKVFMGFAAATSADAYEAALGPNGQVRGVFTARLLRGLEGAAADELGIVRTASLINYLSNSTELVGSEIPVSGDTESLGRKHVFPEADDLVFAKVTHPLYTLRLPVPDGTVVSIVKVANDTERTIASETARAGRIEVRLPLGLWKAIAANGFSQLFQIGSGTPTNVQL